MDAASHLDLLDTDIETWLSRHESKDLLRFTTVGSVDDGKSTLIGRLLVDTDAVYEDQLRDARQRDTETVDLARITDGLRAEREQGITIDVAYRYFTTATRKFIIADTPGHVQYTRNMATGASTADLAIILIDARLGVLQQSRRHAYIASLLGIPHLTVAVNKMDLVDWDRGVFEAIKREFEAFVSKLDFVETTFIPVSALAGENIVHRGESMPWYEGPSILGHLQTVDVRSSFDYGHFRYPVQYVLRPHQDYRGFAARVASGVVRKGDPILVLPSRATTRVAGIDTYDGELPHAFVPQSVVLRLEDEVDVSRGDMLVHPGDEPRVTHAFDAMMVWMDEKPLDTRKSYLLKHTTRYVRAEVRRVHHHVDMETLAESPAETLALNDIGRVSVTCHRPLYVDPYVENRATGAFIVIDTLTNHTVGAGMILPPDGTAAVEAGATPGSGVSPSERAERLRQRGAVVGIAGDGALSRAFALERRLFDLGYTAAVVRPSEHAPSIARALADAGLLALVVEGEVAPLAAHARLEGEAPYLEVAAALALDAPLDSVVEPLREAGLLLEG